MNVGLTDRGINHKVTKAQKELEICLRKCLSGFVVIFVGLVRAL